MGVGEYVEDAIGVVESRLVLLASRTERVEERVQSDLVYASPGDEVPRSLEIALKCKGEDC